jgi:hypothetical protein
LNEPDTAGPDSSRTYLVALLDVDEQHRHVRCSGTGVCEEHSNRSEFQLEQVRAPARKGPLPDTCEFAIASRMDSNSAPVAYAAGIFLAAAVTTNLFVALIALVYPIAYVFLSASDRTPSRVYRGVLGPNCGGCRRDSARGCARLARSRQRHAFIFFEAQINVIHGGQFVKQPGSARSVPLRRTS